MQWDLGLRGAAVLGAMSLGYGLVAGLLVGGGWVRRLRTVAITSVACFAVGLFTSEVWFGWATEEELQPNIDGLSSDEALLSGMVTCALAVVIGRRLGRRPAHRASTHTAHRLARHR